MYQACTTPGQHNNSVSLESFLVMFWGVILRGTADPEAYDTENDVQEKLAAATSLDEDGQWWQKDAEDEEQDVSNGESCRSVNHLVCGCASSV
jgi:hypothetical protein